MKNELAKRTESEQMKQTTYDYVILRPGGNDTCLIITDTIPSSEKRKQINDLMQTHYENVEQVGFLQKGDTPTLVMAGGEFCGNATRSAAWQYLQGMPGVIEINVSGVAKPLTAGVTEEGEAYAEMPIYAEISRIKKENASDYIVEMEGITHYITFGDTSMQAQSPEEIKQKAYETLRNKKLDTYPAAGVIYVSNSENGIKIDPVVYVRDVDTLYYETACGSGTTAVGMALSLISGRSIQNLPVRQPSGSDIKVSIDYNGKEFTGAKIQGQITELSQGNVERMKNDTLFTEKIDTDKKLQKALTKNNLSSLYQDVFGKPPYNETFSDKEVTELFKKYVSDGLLYLTSASSEIVGFGAALPLKEFPELINLVQQTTIDKQKTWYMADLGVKEEFRRKGIAKKLVMARLNALQEGTTALMRTSIYNIASQTLYTSLGFTQIPNVYQEVEQTRTDGTIQIDKRLFLQKKI